ncbi:S8 family peptidase [Rummeliibacillus sp. NPDC094406]|uniref:S8 family peptidase n=1 Tax=Rummeliibacillus sp. NPDC094406 TaxID=3364511 RepID=UPI00382F2C14
MNSFTKKFAAAGLSCALALTPITSFTANAKTGSATTMLQKLGKTDQTETGKKTANYSDDTIIIKYSSPLTASDHRKAGGTVLKDIKDLNYLAVKVTNKKNLQQTLQNYAKNKKVVSVSLSPKYKLSGTVDPKVSEQYMHSLLKTADAQKLAGKNQVKVAVIDTGIDRNHPELKGSVVKSTNIINPMNTTTPDTHGTHVAGIIAGKKDNGIGGYGLDPAAKILSLDVFDGGFWTFDYTIANAILEAVDEGADVINMSLGGSVPSEVLQEAIDKAISKGVIVVAAAGNEASDMAVYPAKYEGVISVGSINKEKKLSDYSSYGPSTDVVAPGEDVYSSFYDLQKGSTFTKLSGTSMASPVVAGTVALLLSKHPNLKPAEVEYILEKTATDLGEKGFDNRYGSGLINPVAALKFDVKKIPSLVTAKWGEKEILNNAEKVVAPAEIKHNFTKPSEQKWVQLSVEKGQYIQTSLSGASQYDYKMMIQFYGDNEQQKIEVNDVTEGKTEGKLIQAPFSGTVAIGIKDVNGSYDDSNAKQSHATLKVEKLDQLPEDESTLESPINIENWPYKKDSLFMTGEKSDEDYFHFTSKEAQLMKFSVTGIPGVDLSLSVYEKEQLFPTDENGKEIPLGENTDEVYPQFSSNTGGTSAGETLMFQTEPNKEYYLKVTNTSSFSDFNILQLLFGNFGSSGVKEPATSAIPYSVNLEGKAIPEDEDSLDESTLYSEEGITIFGGNFMSTFFGMGPSDSSKQIELLESGARSYQLGGSAMGYLQNTSDQDWFKLTPTSDGIYQFNLPTPSKNIPNVSLYEVVTEEGEDGKTYQNLSTVATNEDWNSWDDPITDHFVASLKANKKYYLSVSPNYNVFQIPYDGYQITSKLLVNNPGDKYEENDKPEQAKTFPTTGLTANFATANDIDSYYFTAPKDSIYGVKFSRTELTSSLKAKYPKELLAPFLGMIQISEDVNKNHKLDEQDIDRSSYILNITEDGTNTGSFEAKKGKSYFVITHSYVDSMAGITLWPYQLKINAVNKLDEDAKSKVTKNKPSKPLKLKKNSSKSYSATGFFNSGYENGDSDWYVYDSKKANQVTFTLDAGKEIDGVIEVYRNGKKVAKSDIYEQGDKEIVSLKMKKGTYYVKVRDSKGRASIDPYKLSLKIK